MTRARPHSILVVEDEPAVADLLVTLLQDEGYTVALARDGAAALDLLDPRGASSTPFSLVLLDMMLPAVAGGLVLQHALAVDARVPVVALSADPAALAQGIALGAAATLGKPFDIVELLALVERHCAPPRA